MIDGITIRSQYEDLYSLIDDILFLVLAESLKGWTARLLGAIIGTACRSNTVAEAVLACFISYSAASKIFES